MPATPTRCPGSGDGVKATLAYQVKRALFTLLTVQGQPGFPLEDVQVTYRAPTNQSRADVFLAGHHSFQTETSGEPGRVVVSEVVSVAVLIRVSDPAAEVDATDTETEFIADVVAAALDVKFLDDDEQLEVLAIASTQGDYDPVLGYGRSVLALEVQVQCLIV